MKHFIDLHRHLDGAITADIARQLAKLQGIILPSDDDAELVRLLRVPEGCRSLNDFLACFALPVSLMQMQDGLTEAAFMAARDMQAEGIAYGELRFAPQLHTARGMKQRDVITAVLDGLRKSGVHVNLILCCMRGKDNEAANLETAALAGEFLVEDGGVVALDLAGAEALYPTANYRKLFAQAHDAGIPFTIHAGEADGAESIRLAIEYGAKRIGHGVRAFEDEVVMRLLADRGIPLEMCPTSNRQTVAVPDMANYPFMDYLNRGIRVTLNTDDPAIEGTHIRQEYRYMEEVFGLSEAQEKLLMTNAIDAAFTSRKVKDELRRICEAP